MIEVKDLTTSEIVKIVCEGLGSAKPVDNKNGILQFQTVCHNPAHQGKFKLYYYADTKSFHCYTGCSESFDIIGLIKRARHCEAKEAFQLIKELVYDFKDGFGEDEWEDYYYDCSKEVVVVKNEPINKAYLNLFPLDEPYLWYKEGISVHSMRKFNIRMDYCNNKIIVPHFNINGDLIGIRGRALNEDEIEMGCKYMPIKCDGKYLAHSLGSNLYGIDLNKETIKKVKKVILFEGEKSVMKYEDYSGGSNIALAVCGSNISAAQIKLIEDLGVEEVIIAFDKMYTENKSAEAREYRDKIVKLGLKFPSTMSVYYLWDDNDLIDYKNAPIDHGNKVFKAVLRAKKLIKSRIEDGREDIQDYSYSRLEKYINCPYAFKLRYIDGNYPTSTSLALGVGTLLHKVNEYICSCIIKGIPVDYPKILDYIENAGNTDVSLDLDSEKKDEGISGTKILRREFFEDWLTTDTKSHKSMKAKVNDFIENIHSLEDSFKNSEWQPYKTEEPFCFQYKGVTFKGNIDRIDINTKTGDLRVIDYKTKDKPFDKKDLATPLQFVIYAMAVMKKFGKLPVEFIYDLPLIHETQNGGTKGFIERGEKKITSLLESITNDLESNEFKPKTGPLCYWCDFNKQNPNAQNEYKNLCPYYCKWTPTDKTFDVNQVYGKKFIL